MNPTTLKNLMDLFIQAALALGCQHTTEGESYQVSPGGDAKPPIFWLEFPMVHTGDMTSARRALRQCTWTFEVLGRPAAEDREDMRNTLSTMDAIAEGIITWLTENEAARDVMTIQTYNSLTVHGNDDELAGVRVEVTFESRRNVAPCVVR